MEFHSGLGDNTIHDWEIRFMGNSGLLVLKTLELRENTEGLDRGHSIDWTCL